MIFQELNDRRIKMETEINEIEADVEAEEILAEQEEMKEKGLLFDEDDAVEVVDENGNVVDEEAEAKADLSMHDEDTKIED